MRCYRPEQTLTVGDLELGAEARVIAVVSAGEALAMAHAAREQGADLLEVRLDLDPAITPERAGAVLRDVRAHAGGPLVATVRLAGQRGAWAGDEAMRLAILEAAAEEADALDVELSAVKIRAGVRALCDRAGKRLIVSFHDTVGTPSVAGMERLAREAVEDVGADIFKLCPLAHDAIDMARLLSFAQTYRDRHGDLQIVAMALGTVGAPSRLVGPAFGSCMTYGYVEGWPPAVEGQYPIAALRAAFDADALKATARARKRALLERHLGTRSNVPTYLFE